jgi:hypothetical protein
VRSADGRPHWQPTSTAPSSDALLFSIGEAAATHLVDVNLLVSPGDPLANRARDHLDAARGSRDTAAALPR